MRNSQEEGVLALPVAYTFPASLIPDYEKNIHPKMKKMFAEVGIKDGMIFAQCLIEDGKCLVYDIGYRLTGSMEYHLQEKVAGYNPLEMLIDFSLTGDMFANTSPDLEISPYWDKYAYNLSFLVKTGRRIDSIEGIEDLSVYPGAMEAVIAHPEGEVLPESTKGTLKQIMLRVLGEADSVEEMKQALDDLYHLLTVEDTEGHDILLKGLGTSEVDGWVLESENE